jgi:hypothetical protein
VLGVSPAGPPTLPRRPLDAAMLFAPAGELVPVAMRALDAGATLAVAGIHLSDIPRLDCAAELSRTSSYAASPLHSRRRRGVFPARRLPWRPARRRGASARGGRSGLRRPDHRRRRPHPGVDRTGAIRSGRSCLLVIRGWRPIGCCMALFGVTATACALAQRECGHADTDEHGGDARRTTVAVGSRRSTGN